jgi:hypothetical protein
MVLSSFLLLATASAEVPTQARLSVYSDFDHLEGGTFALSFATSNATSSSYTPSVILGTTPSKLTRTLTGTTVAPTKCAELGNILSYAHHTVLLNQLRPLTTYYYRFGDASSHLEPAAPLSFRTPPALGDAAPLRLAFFVRKP